jgi:hypothetical protein
MQDSRPQSPREGGGSSSGDDQGSKKPNLVRRSLAIIRKVIFLGSLIAQALTDAGHPVHQSNHSKQDLWKSIDEVMRTIYQTEFDWAWRKTPPVKNFRTTS